MNEKTFAENHKELERLHELIKNNKYRENMRINYRYGKGYYELLRQLIDTFYAIMKSGEDTQVAKIDPLLLIHDFRSACTTSMASIIWIVRETDENDTRRKEIMEKLGKELKDDWDDIDEKMVELELNLTCIHAYINTFRFDMFYAWERGVFMKYVWNEETQEYEPKEIIKEKKPGNKEYILKNNVFPTLNKE